MKWESFDSYEALSQTAAEILFKAIHRNPREVLGLPTGRTPIGMYERLVAECRREYHCFREVTTFNLDEYVGIPRDHTGSYYTYMKQHLFDYADIDPSRAHIPNGNAPDLVAECRRYEAEIKRAGGRGSQTRRIFRTATCRRARSRWELRRSSSRARSCFSPREAESANRSSACARK